MRGRNKSLLEDIVIISILGTVIFGIYTLFFHSEETNEVVQTPQIVENKVENPLEKIPTVAKQEPISEETKKTDITSTPNTVAEEKIVQKEPEKQIVKPVIVQPEKVIAKESESQIPTQQTQELDEKAKVELFYRTIRDKIYVNLEKSLDKTALKNDEFVNIRLTILKDGRFEQLTLIEGNKEYFELIKPSINQAFPVAIDESLKQSFPRYFRMKIEFK